ncbi:bifunctional DNA-formamidopyrimidine glycosylase/DNA-(apurinic or apyrimidinic site) lyase [Magnetovibrio sp.]|uniref:bifunctional DNA-formamidopyrimidine glycosylase/DNA-(apurinic or apyrimidinic site) lyase n=1 Tax=Magnetovibrio sp. TaxID=2024836 RepID=UPI002F91FA29
MPELPEVETVRRGLAPVMEGAVFARVQLRRADLRIPFPKDFIQRLEGASIVTVGRRSKYLLIQTQKDTLIWHLGMSGQVRIYAPGDTVAPVGKHDHVQFDLNTGAHIVFTDPRRFGLMDLCATDALADHRLIRSIGPEPLGNAFSGPVLAQALKGKRVAIKQAIMDARVVCGVGNIYASESLYRAGISPKRAAGTVQGGRAEKLATAIKAILNEAIQAGGSTLKDHRTTDGGLGYFQHNFAVYDRAGQACPGCDCDVSKTGGIQRLEQGGRSTYYCPRKQR